MDREELIRKYAGGERDKTGRKIQAHWNDRVDKGIIDRASNKRGFAKLERVESSEANNGMSPL